MLMECFKKIHLSLFYIFPLFFLFAFKSSVNVLNLQASLTNMVTINDSTIN